MEGLDTAGEITSDVSLRNQDYFPDIITLPFGFCAEGIETGKGNDFFVSSWTAGGIYKGNLRSGEGTMLVEPNGMGLAGLSYDPRSDYLFSANAWSGLAQVFQGATGELLATYDLAARAGSLSGPNGALINDVIVTQFAAYFTDSFNPLLYKIPLGPGGKLPDACLTAY